MREKLEQHWDKLRTRRLEILGQAGAAFDKGDIGAAMETKPRLMAVEDVLTAMEESNGDAKCDRCNGDGVSPQYGHFSLPYEKWEWDVCECVHEKRRARLMGRRDG